jgi:hypothetical protein
MDENSINKYRIFIMPWDIIEKIEDYKETNNIDDFSEAMYELIKIGFYKINNNVKTVEDNSNDI